MNIFIVAVIAFLSACVGTPWGFQDKPASVSKHGLKDIQPIHEEVMYCNIGAGEAMFANGWGAFSNRSFTVYKEGRTNIKLRNSKNAETQAFQVILNNAGQKILFCPILNGTPNQRISCKSLYFIESDLEIGFKRTLNLSGVIKDSAVTCSYQPENLKSLFPAR